MAKSSMKSIYTILRALDLAENGLTDRRLKFRFPFLDVDGLLSTLRALGYISHRIAGFKVKVRRETKISHDYNSRWYPTDLGHTALERYLQEHPPTDKRLVILFAAVCAACAFILFLCARPPVS